MCCIFFMLCHANYLVAFPPAKCQDATAPQVQLKLTWTLFVWVKQPTCVLLQEEVRSLSENPILYLSNPAIGEFESTVANNLAQKLHPNPLKEKIHFDKNLSNQKKGKTKNTGKGLLDVHHNKESIQHVEHSKKQKSSRCWPLHQIGCDVNYGSIGHLKLFQFKKGFLEKSEKKRMHNYTHFAPQQWPKKPWWFSCYYF